MTVKPRPASTVVLMNNEEKIYLTKRPETMKFLGGYYVFPGGAVEEGDHLVPTQYIQPSEEEFSFSPSHLVAAARELFEEVGIFLCGKGDTDDWKKPPYDYRKQLIDDEITIGDVLLSESKILDLRKLKYFGHFITPEISPIRYDTRFFLALLPEGQNPQPDEREIAEAFWITPKDALDAYYQKELPMVPPTVLSLQAILNYQQGGTLEMPRGVNLLDEFRLR